ncbi:MFS transporter [Nocardia sp. CA-120079]|uniref:MFS transporter n=1 Tax=Nocardia sp. CA-120079 TaxID=3239974 RepID=UPI003D9661B3
MSTSARSSRWSVLVAYALVAIASQVLWLTYAPVATVAADQYHVSLGAIGWLTNTSQLLYVVLAVPVGLLLDRAFRTTLAAGAVLSAVGGVVRLIGDNFAWALTGQTLAAIAQPLILSAITKVAHEYLDEEGRTLGIAMGTCSITVGQLLAFALGAVFSRADQLPLLVGTGASMSVLAAVVLVVALRRPSMYPSGAVAAGFGSVRSVWGDTSIKLLCGAVFIGFGIYIATTTWLEALLQPAGVDAASSGMLLVVMLIAGVVGAISLPSRITKRGKESSLMCAAAMTTSFAAFALAIYPGFGVGMVALAGVGLLNLAALPVILEIAERRAAQAEGAAASMIWMAGNAGGLVVTLLVGLLTGEPSTAFLLIGVIALAEVPLVLALRRESAAVVTLPSAT